MALPPFEVTNIAREGKPELLKLAPPITLKNAKSIKRETLNAAGVVMAKDEARRIVRARIFTIDPDLTIGP